MSTHVIEGAQTTVRATHQKQRFTNKVCCEIVADICYLARVSYDLPCAREEFLLLLEEDTRVGVERRRQRPGACNVGVYPRELVRNIHKDAQFNGSRTLYAERHL